MDASIWIGVHLNQSELGYARAHALERQPRRDTRKTPLAIQPKFDDISAIRYECSSRSGKHKAGCKSNHPARLQALDDCHLQRHQSAA